MSKVLIAHYIVLVISLTLYYISFLIMLILNVKNMQIECLESEGV